ncbi:unnamed protein product [Brassica napus]|uniref:(rape) hypothetical protein n=1 Tax=Brassica napus TaxID=3708 RepID=A0A816I0E4_BRANA|nr:unnamed protein product [Brassica napus]
MFCNTMITGLCSYGRADQALEVFERMCETGVARDAISRITLWFKGFLQGE